MSLRRKGSAEGKAKGDLAVGTADGDGRPVTVTLGLLVCYVEGAAFLAVGTRNPQDSNGTRAAAGVAFIMLGVLVLALTTLTRTGSRLARACLVVPLVVAAVVLVRDDEIAAVWRVLPVVGSAVVVVLLLLLRPSRRWFGDDATTLGTP